MDALVHTGAYGAIKYGVEYAEKSMKMAHETPKEVFKDSAVHGLAYLAYPYIRSPQGTECTSVATGSLASLNFLGECDYCFMRDLYLILVGVGYQKLFIKSREGLVADILSESISVFGSSFATEKVMAKKK